MNRATLTWVLALTMWAGGARAATILVEAESFKDHGGWSLDTQFIHIMGSPYLLAHGLGTPVKDATTSVTFPAAGRYRVWVRTKDWVARWKAPGQPGRFRILIDGKALATTFGTEGAEWSWHDGGEVELPGGRPVTLALRDLTGFEGRCDAIVFSSDAGFSPPADAKVLAAWRKKALGLPDKPVEAGPYDLVVVGGGYAGIAASISAARMGLKVALIQDRSVLGGNGSSEIRVWSQGGTTLGKYPRVGEIVEEFCDTARASPGTFEEFGDAKKEALVRAEKNVDLRLNTHAYAVEAKEGRIVAVLARDTRTGAETRFAAPFFADCTGHGTIGALAGAEFDMAEKGHMGMSNMWRWSEAPTPQSFPETPWALPLTMKDFPYPKNGKAEWFWEAGFDRHPIDDLEYIRDWNFRAAYGAFNAMKNGDGKDRHANAKLDWMAYVGGNRESRLLRGDVVLTRDDIVDKKEYEDAFVASTWSIDLHVPKEQYAARFPEDPFISKAVYDNRVDKKVGYPIPYRCFYSKNVANLFMAGRNISVDRGALGSVRVMRTGGMMGEIVGKAASIAVKHGCTPRDVYYHHLDELKELAQQPGNARRATVRDPIVIDLTIPRPPDPDRSLAEPAGAARIELSKVPGIVIDDEQATFAGPWVHSRYEAGFLGKGYRHDDNAGKGQRTARFEFRVPAAGRYEVRLAYRGGTSRSDAVPVTVISAAGQTVVKVNQRVNGRLEHGFHSLGVFEFAPGAVGAVVISNAGTKGHVVVDAVQVVPAP